jgi:glycosyltransferase involved in cell wall biosynthesis
MDNPSMRVLIAHSFYRRPGGEDRYVEQQMDLLLPQHEVELFSRHNEDLGGGVSTAARMTASSPQERRALRQVIDRFHPDLIHLHNAYPALGPAVHLEAQRAGIPLVMTVHNCRLRCPNGYMFTEGQPCRRCEAGNYSNALVHHCFSDSKQAASYASALWVHRFMLRLDNKVSSFITPSEFMHDRMLEWGFPRERVNVARNFTDHPLGTPDPGRYGIYVGRLSSEKGVNVLLEALAIAGDPPFRIVGDGPVMPALRDLAHERALRNTRFLGQLPSGEVAQHLRGARFLALPSLWDENAPLAALEAMSAGRPLLVTKGGGLPELVRSGEGFVCRRDDARDLADKIQLISSDDDLCRAAGAAALARANAEFTPTAHLRRLEEIYESVTAGPSGVSSCLPFGLPPASDDDEPTVDG